MYRLVYVSTARAGLSDEDIAHILNVSQSNNYERYLTGFLAHNGQSFMQALEGEQGEVQEIYNRILNDHRHTCVTQILGEEITERAFPNWAMNYYRVDGPPGIGMVVRRDDPVDNLLPSDMPRDLLHMFSQFLNIRYLAPQE